jgi:hypothetical protein
MSKRRTSFHLPEDTSESLRSILGRSWYDSSAGAVRAAVSAFEDLLVALNQGVRIVIRNTNGDEWPYSPHAPFRQIQIDAAPPKDLPTPKNVFLPELLTEKIESIRALSHLQMGSEIVRAAIFAFDDLTRIAGAGYDIVVQFPTGQERKYSPYAPLIAAPTKTGPSQPARKVRQKQLAGATP